MKAERGSDLQMPAYMTLLWMWEKAVGRNEYALRSLNVVFFLFAIGFAARWLRGPSGLKWFFVILACSSAYLWAYLSEARPYILQFLGATCTAIAWNNLKFFFTPAKVFEDFTLACVGLLILLLASLSTSFFVCGIGGAFLWFAWKHSLFSSLWRDRRFRAFSVAFILIGLALAVFYFWTILVGAKASPVGRTNLLTCLFSLYEMGGFMGVGPSRQSLRENPFLALSDFWGPVLIFLLIYLFWLFLLWNHQSSFYSNFSPLPGVLTVMLCLATCALLVTGFLAPFRVSGRHFMPLFPFFLIWSSRCALTAWQRSPRSLWISFGGLFLASMYSCLCLRFSARHNKDDYRSAADFIVRHAPSGQTIWWAADGAASQFYHVPNPLILMNPDSKALDSLPEPNWVVLSKPDIFDGRGAIRAFLHGRNLFPTARFQAFEIYRSDPKLPR